MDDAVMTVTLEPSTPYVLVRPKSQKTQHMCTPNVTLSSINTEFGKYCMQGWPVPNYSYFMKLPEELDVHHFWMQTVSSVIGSLLAPDTF
eukprot:1157896-Pelagomonas_calceolata.AAC.7